MSIPWNHFELVLRQFRASPSREGAREVLRCCQASPTRYMSVTPSDEAMIHVELSPESEPDVDQYKELAEFYAQHFNDLAEGGLEPTDEALFKVEDELSGGGWVLFQDDEDEWQVAKEEDFDSPNVRASRDGSPLRCEFNPNEPRDNSGKWTAGGTSKGRGDDTPADLPRGSSPISSLGHEVKTKESDWKEHGTESKAFQDWFSGSKVTTWNKKPAVVYHGTSSQFSEFDPAKGKSVTDKLGAWFAADANLAEERLKQVNRSDVFGFESGSASKGSAIMPVYLSIKNPLRLKTRTAIEDYCEKRLVIPTEMLKKFRGYFPEERTEYQDAARSDLEKYETSPACRKRVNRDFLDAADQGWDPEDIDAVTGLIRPIFSEYDGIVIADDNGFGTAYVAFDSSQAKSAIANRGTFDPANKRVEYESDETPLRYEWVQDQSYRGKKGAKWINSENPKATPRYQPKRPGDKSGRKKVLTGKAPTGIKPKRTRKEHDADRAGRKVNLKKLMEKLSPHAGARFSVDEKKKMKRSFDALMRHHSENVLHRIEELTDEAHAAYTGAKGAKKKEISKKLRGLHEMMMWAQGEAKKPKAKKEPKAEEPKSSVQTEKPAESSAAAKSAGAKIKEIDSKFKELGYSDLDSAISLTLGELTAKDIVDASREAGFVQMPGANKQDMIGQIARRIKERKGSWERTQFREPRKGLEPFTNLERVRNALPKIEMTEAEQKAVESDPEYKKLAEEGGDIIKKRFDWSMSSAADAGVPNPYRGRFEGKTPALVAARDKVLAELRKEKPKAEEESIHVRRGRKVAENYKTAKDILKRLKELEGKYGLIEGAYETAINDPTRMLQLEGEAIALHDRLAIVERGDGTFGAGLKGDPKEFKPGPFTTDGDLPSKTEILKGEIDALAARADSVGRELQNGLLTDSPNFDHDRKLRDELIAELRKKQEEYRREMAKSDIIIQPLGGGPATRIPTKKDERPADAIRDKIEDVQGAIERTQEADAHAEAAHLEKEKKELEQSEHAALVKEAAGILGRSEDELKKYSSGRLREMIANAGKSKSKDESVAGLMAMSGSSIGNSAGANLGAASVVASKLKGETFAGKITADDVATVLDEHRIVGSKSINGRMVFDVANPEAMKIVLNAAKTGSHEGKPVASYNDLVKVIEGLGKPIGKSGGILDREEETPSTTAEVTNGNVNDQLDAKVDALVAGDKRIASLGLANTLSQRFSDGQKIDAKELFALADAAHSGTRAQGAYGPSEAYDSLEAGFNKSLLNKTDPKVDLKAATKQVEELAEKVNQLPTQTNRSGTKETHQQFSTPPHYAFAVNWLANIKPGEVVLEPSAGTGCLAIHAKNAGAVVYANEYDPARAEFLKDQFGDDKTMIEDGEQIGAILPQRGIRPSVVVMNPPFSQTAGRMGDKKVLMTGANHITQALQTLQPGGRLVSIVGGGVTRDGKREAGMSPGSPTYREWFQKLAANGYRLRANVGISGNEYKKYGTNFATRVLVIDKPVVEPVPEEGFTGTLIDSLGREYEYVDGKKVRGPDDEKDGIVVTGNVDTVPELMAKLEGVRNDRPTPDNEASSERTGDELSGPDEGDHGPGSTVAPGVDASVPGIGQSGLVDGVEGGGQTEGQHDDVLAPAGKKPGSSGGVSGNGPGGDGQGFESGGGEPGRGVGGGKAASGRTGGKSKGGGGRGKRGPSTGGKSVSGAGNRVPELRPAGPVKFASGPSEKTKKHSESADHAKTQADLGEVLYEDYQPTINIKGMHPHISPLVETSAMSAVNLPAPTMHVNLSPDQVEGKLVDDFDQDGNPIKRDIGLSSAGLEAVTYVCQANEQLLPATKEGVQYRRWGLIGDATGTGKGREIVGVIAHNLNEGRKKHVWVSKSDDLMNDAKRDFADMGLDPNLIFDFDELRGKSPPKDGVCFMTYSMLRGEAKDENKTKNLDVLSNWMGSKFDGVMAFDEAHLMGNSLEIKEEGRIGAKKAAKQALAAIELQKRFPDARGGYWSATAATEPENLAFADRLGLWGPGTEFDNKLDFISQMNQGGTAALESVAQSMKAMGLYSARQLATDDNSGRVDENKNSKYKGMPIGRIVTDPLEHPLSDDQKLQYDQVCEGWQNVLKEMHTIIDQLAGEGHNKAAGAAARSQFWGAQQRFFNQMLTCMATTSVLNDAEQDIEEGRAPVIQLVNTMDATYTRASKARGEDEDLDDIDVSPKEILINFVNTSFPVHRFEEYLDSEGHKQIRLARTTAKAGSKGCDVGGRKYAPGEVIPREVLDVALKSKTDIVGGDLIPDPVAIAKREEILGNVSDLRIPESPLDQIIHRFGAESVAEITGRKLRRVWVKDDEGNEKAIEENRGKGYKKLDTDAFQSGKKKILVFSGAGSTGKSYHAERGVKNQGRRVQYVLQPGWSAAPLMQSLGRTHRTNQTSAPVIRPVAIPEVPGNKRFLSSASRRLASLGSLTRGQQKAGGGGLYGTADNLETPQAEEGLRRWWRDLKYGGLAGNGLDYEETMRQLGYDTTYTDPNTGITRQREVPVPKITQFLNRLLVLNLETQNKAFETFDVRHQQAIEQAIKDGSLDRGVENYPVDKIFHKTDEPIFTDKSTGAEARHLLVKTQKKTNRVDFKRMTVEHKPVKFVRNRQSGHIWAVNEGPQETDRITGRVYPTYKLRSVAGGDQKVEREIVDLNEEDASWAPVDINTAETLWSEQYAKTPEYRDGEEHFVTGALLPIWKRIPTGNRHPQIYRLKLDNGKTVVGRHVPAGYVEEFMRNMGKHAESKTHDPVEVHSGLESGTIAQARLQNGWKIKPVTFQYETRLEITGAIGPSTGRNLAGFGVITEKGAGGTRYFVPTGPSGAEVLAKLPTISEVTSKSGSTRKANEEKTLDDAIALQRMDFVPLLRYFRSKPSGQAARLLIRHCEERPARYIAITPRDESRMEHELAPDNEEQDYYKVLSDFYADHWNDLTEAGLEPSEEGMQKAAEELAEGDWVVFFDEDDHTWKVVHADHAPHVIKYGAGQHMFVYRCPACGGIAYGENPVQGTTFRGSVMCSRCGTTFPITGASRYSVKNGHYSRDGGPIRYEPGINWTQDASYSGSKGAKWTAPGQRPRYQPTKPRGRIVGPGGKEVGAVKAHTEKRAARGDVDMDSMKRALMSHAHHELTPKEMKGLKSSFHALMRHHGKLVIHRLEELANGLHSAIEKTPKRNRRIRDAFSRKLKGIEHMLGWAEGEIHYPTPKGGDSVRTEKPTGPQNMHGQNLNVDEKGWPKGTESWAEPGSSKEPEEPGFFDLPKPKEEPDFFDLPTDKKWNDEAQKRAWNRKTTGEEEHKREFFTPAELSAPAIALNEGVEPDAGYDKIKPKALEANAQYQALLDLGKGLASALGYTTIAPGPNADAEFEAAMSKPGGVLQLANIKGSNDNGDRSSQKVKTDYASVEHPNGDWRRIGDMVRASIAVDRTEDFEPLLNEFRKAGVKFAKAPKDRINVPTEDGYRDLMFHLRMPNGMVAEMQLHLKPILLAKKKAHPLYVVKRDIQAKVANEKRVATPDEERIVDDCTRKMNAIYKKAWDQANGRGSEPVAEASSQAASPESAKPKWNAKSQAAKSTPVEKRNPGESDKEYAKRVIDKLPVPKKIAQDHAKYFNTEKSKSTVSLGQLVSTKPDEENEQAGTNAAARFWGSAHGLLAKRDPITVRKRADGKYDIIDGNGTFAAAKRLGWKNLPIQMESGAAESAKTNAASQNTSSDAKGAGVKWNASHERAKTEVADLAKEKGVAPDALWKRVLKTAGRLGLTAGHIVNTLISPAQYDDSGDSLIPQIRDAIWGKPETPQDDPLINF